MFHRSLSVSSDDSLLGVVSNSAVPTLTREANLELEGFASQSRQNTYMLKIAQISDIHYRGSERHEEYKQVFNTMFDLWNSNPEKHKPDLIVCTGDIFHTKTQGITPEVINEITWMFKSLLKFAPVISILGNHDANLKNLNRVSVIEAIHNSIDNPNFYLFRNSLSFPLEISTTNKFDRSERHSLDASSLKEFEKLSKPLVHKLLFHVFSPFDLDGWKSIAANPEYHYNIALYHGPIQGCLYDNEEPAREHSELSIKDFSPFDLTMLGDIHKQQFLHSVELSSGDPLPNIGYPGSLIQQNFGETLNKGFLQWNLYHPTEISQGNLPHVIPTERVENERGEAGSILKAANPLNKFIPTLPDNFNSNLIESLKEDRTPVEDINLSERFSFLNPKEVDFFKIIPESNTLSSGSVKVNHLWTNHLETISASEKNPNPLGFSERATPISASPLGATHISEKNPNPVRSLGEPSVGSWPISEKFFEVHFLTLRNAHRFFSIDYPGTPSLLFNHLEELANNELTHSRVRVTLPERNLTPTERAEIALWFKSKKVSLWKTDPKYKNKLNNIDIGGNKELERIAFKRDVNALCDLVRNYIKGLKKTNIKEEDIVSMRGNLQEYLDKINNATREDLAVRETMWSIDRMEFDNLYGYGDGNEFNIKSHNGFVGVFGPNRSGKSSLIGSLCFGLFNTTDRGPVKSSFIVNRNKTEGSCKIWLKANGEDYHIDRKVGKAIKRNGEVDESKASTSVDFYKVETDGTLTSMVKKNDDSRVDTDKVIRSIIGNPQDFFMTTLCSSRGMDNFISEKDTQRKVILNKFLDTDIFEQIYKLAYEEYNEVSKRLNGLSLDETQDKINESYSIIKALKESLDLNQSSINANKLAANNLDLALSGYDSYKRLKSSIDSTQMEMNFLLKKLKEKQEALDCGDKIAAVNSFLKSFPTYDELNSKAALIKETAEKIKELKQTKNKIEIKINEVKQTISTKEKSIVKLTTVPCGDSFPDCRFIKDSHLDKGSIEADRASLRGLLGSVEEVIKGLEELGINKDKELEEVYRDIQVRKEKENVVSFYKKEQELHKAHIAESEKMLGLKTEYRDKLQAELEQINSAGSNFEELNEQKKVLSRQLIELDNNQSSLIRKIKEGEFDIEAMNNRLSAAKTDLKKYKILENIVEVFSKNAIPAMVLKSQLPVLNREINKILSGIVDFQLNLETEIGSNSLEVFIIDSKSGPRVIEMCSGMERVISSLAIRAALHGLTTLPKNDMLVIDEGLLELDAESKAKCLEFIQGTLRSYYRLILIISHENQIKESVDSMIEVSLGNETSFIKV